MFGLKQKELVHLLLDQTLSLVVEFIYFGDVYISLQKLVFCLM